MEQTPSIPFSRSLRFRREREGKSVWKSPTYRFVLQRSEDGQEIGVLTIQGTKASFQSAQGRHEDFAVRRSLWSSKFYLEGSDKQEAARYGYGWDLKPYLRVRGEDKYYIKTKRHSYFREPEPGTPSQTITFSRGETPVMQLKSYSRYPLFSNELTVAMEGELLTDLDDNQLIAYLLLFYQTHIEARNKSAAG